MGEALLERGCCHHLPTLKRKVSLRVLTRLNNACCFRTARGASVTGISPSSVTTMDEARFLFSTFGSGIDSSHNRLISLSGMVTGTGEREFERSVTKTDKEDELKESSMVGGVGGADGEEERREKSRGERR